MKTQRFFLLGLSLLVISAICLLGLLIVALLPQRSSASVPVGKFSQGAGGGPTSLADAPQQDLVVEKDWPVQVDMNTSDTIELVLALNTATGPAPTATSGNHRVAQEASLAVGAPGATLQEAFGLGYQVSASAHLVATTFDTELLGPEERSLDQSAVAWSWNISPKSTGLQIVSADIEVQWKPLQANSPLPVILSQLWQTRFTINVTEPWLDAGRAMVAQIIAVLGALGGIGLTVPWIWETVSALVANRKKPEKPDQGGSQTAGAAPAPEKKEVPASSIASPPRGT